MTSPSLLSATCSCSCPLSNAQYVSTAPFYGYAQSLAAGSAGTTITVPTTFTLQTENSQFSLQSTAIYATAPTTTSCVQVLAWASSVPVYSVTGLTVVSDTAGFQVNYLTATTSSNSTYNAVFAPYTSSVTVVLTLQNSLPTTGAYCGVYDETKGAFNSAICSTGTITTTTITCTCTSSTTAYNIYKGMYAVTIKQATIAVTAVPTTTNSNSISQATQIGVGVGVGVGGFLLLAGLAGVYYHFAYAPAHAANANQFLWYDHDPAAVAGGGVPVMPVVIPRTQQN